MTELDEFVNEGDDMVYAAGGILAAGLIGYGVYKVWQRSKVIQAEEADKSGVVHEGTDAGF
ncbi:hypothetical protein [Streptomyces griseosporeus]|uniref:hypothetical protein n=1 Tax=Streptomyces griseosporeus TaxID=1910 RepID=UPI0036FFB982